MFGSNKKEDSEKDIKSLTDKELIKSAMQNSRYASVGDPWYSYKIGLCEKELKRRDLM